MKRSAWIWVLVMGLALASPMFAGEREKCSADTQTCLNKMASNLKSRGWVGIELDHNDSGQLTVTFVEPDSPAMEAGLRAINQLRVFNFRHGLTKEVEAPSVRYSSTPVNGPAKGIGIADHWETIRSSYYEEMGWDPETGKPLPNTLSKLGLGDLIKDL